MKATDAAVEPLRVPTYEDAVTTAENVADSSDPYVMEPGSVNTVVVLVVAAAATPMSTKGAARAPIIITGKRIRTKRFIVIHLSLGSRRLTEGC